jgi:membrane-associated phospholipid phosphatase
MNRTSLYAPVVGLTAILMTGLAGCASSPAAEPGWSQRAEGTARQRLADGQPPRSAADSATRERRAGGDGFADTPTFRLASDTSGTSGAAARMEPANAAEPATSQPSAEVTRPVERGPLPTFGQTVKRDLQEMPRVLWEDTKAVYGNPWNVLALLGAGGASIALRTTNADDHIAEHYERHHAFRGDWPDTFGALGNPATHFALAGVLYLAGEQLQHDKTYEVGRKMFNALTITGVSTMFLKVCAWDDSPNGEWGAWPSGHVSSTMAVATVLNDAYGPVAGVPMFGLTALVGIERLDDGEHWLSDVVFGAVLGWVVGETVMKEHRPEIFGGEVVPYVDVRGGAGIGWFKALGNDPKPAPRPEAAR